jgi:phage repressor protein C with HTH and peptisase S24 domain
MILDENKDKDLDQVKLAEAAGVTKGTVNQWLSGDIKSIKLEYAVGIQERFGYNAVWTVLGKGEKKVPTIRHEDEHKSHLRLAQEELPKPTEEEFAFVLQLDIAAACGDGRFQDHVVVTGGLAFKRSSLRDFGVPEHAARIIYASGGSMAPKIQDGRVVLVNTADTTPVDGKIYLICMPDGSLVLKRLVRDYHPTAGALVWIIRSDNPDKTEFPDKILPPDDRTMIAGRAVWTDSLL